MTAKHYASQDSVANARVSRASQALAPREAQLPHGEPAAAADPVSQLLSQLTPEQLADLRRRLVA